MACPDEQNALAPPAISDEALSALVDRVMGRLAARQENP